MERQFSKIILIATHSGKRPIGTFVDEVNDECEEVERSMAWITAGPHRKEMVFRIKYSCGRCRAVLYTGIVKEINED